MTRSVCLSICGEVERPACLAPAELRALMDADLISDFHCREGWSRLGERLRTLLAFVGAGAAGYVTVGSGEYTAVLTREQAEDERCSSRSSTKEPRALGAPASRGWSAPRSGTAS